MNISAWCLKNNQTSLAIYMLVMLVGVSTYFSIGRNENPDIPVRAAQITTQFPGRSALQVEQEVTHQIEQALRKIPEIKEIKSQSKHGLSIITIQVKFQYLTELERVWRKVRNKVADVSGSLPQGTMAPQVNDDFGDVFGILLSLSGDGFTYRELLDYAEDIRDRLRLLDGVGKVELHGVQDERVFVEFDNLRLTALGLNPQLLAQVLDDTNSSASSGEVNIGPYRPLLRTTGKFEDLEQIRETLLQVPGRADAIRVGDIAQVRRGFVDPPRNLARYDGKPAVVIAVNMEQGGIITKLGEVVRSEVTRIQNDIPWGLSIDFTVEQNVYVETAIADFSGNLFQAFVFVFLVMLLFAGWRIALVVGVLIPSATLSCFVIMPMLGVQLEKVSLAALIIALGILVDNAVVVSERILVLLNQGESRLQAVTKSVSELTMPLLAASLTTIFAFLPIATAESDVGAFCFSLFAVITLALGSSWVLSLTIIPMFCYYVLKPLKRETAVGRKFEAFKPIYKRFLVFWLDRGWSFPVLIFALLMLSGWGFGFVDQLFFPPNDRDMYTVEIQNPFGTKIEATEKTAKKLEDFLLGELNEQVRNVTSFVGYGGPRWYLSLAPEPPNPGYAFFMVMTRSGVPEDVEKVIEQTRRFAERSLPDSRVTVRKLENGPAVGAPIQLRLQGPDLEELYSLKNRIVKLLRATAGVHNIHDDWGAWVAQIVIDQDEARAGRAGLNTADISHSLQTHFSGLRATDYWEGDKKIPVVLRTGEAYRADIAKLRGLSVFSSRVQSGVVPLEQVADISLDWEPASVRRRDTIRTITLKANVTGRFASDALAEVVPKIDALVSSPDWPENYAVTFGGEAEKSAEANESIMAGMPLALGLLLLVLLSQFNSSLKVLIIALTIPPMIIGITPGLLVTSAPFGFMAMLGMISLMGIIVNNAILLIEQIAVEQGEGKELREAIIDASLSRLRPIVMTTVTTIIGLMPLSLFGGEMWRPMANTMMFGLGFATVLTLVLCPVLMFRFYHKRPV